MKIKGIVSAVVLLFIGILFGAILVSGFGLVRPGLIAASVWIKFSVITTTEDYYVKTVKLKIYNNLIFLQIPTYTQMTLKIINF